MKRSVFAWPLIALWCVFRMVAPNTAFSADLSALLTRLSARDVLLVADPEGRILYQHNIHRVYTPASTLKILTGLSALHHFGKSYRFKTEFYLDRKQNLVVKGYGDPLLISETLQCIASRLARELAEFNNLVVDDSYFSPEITIPGRGCSTNPYDAPVGALCANFNTVFYEYDRQDIISAEPQTPITPLAREKIPGLHAKEGRYTFLGKGSETACYAGELLVHFLSEKGVSHNGDIRTGQAGPADELVYTYRSESSLEEVVGKMLTYSNNFMANQILVSLGAYIHGPPGTLKKGVAVLQRYCRKHLHLEDLQLAEGSGISRRNQLSATDMLWVLKAFSGYRHLLTTEGAVRYKSGTLAGIRVRAGYIEPDQGRPYFFVIFLEHSPIHIDQITRAVASHVCQSERRPHGEGAETGDVGQTPTDTGSAGNNKLRLMYSETS